MESLYKYYRIPSPDPSCLTKALRKYKLRSFLIYGFNTLCIAAGMFMLFPFLWDFFVRFWGLIWDMGSLLSYGMVFVTSITSALVSFVSAFYPILLLSGVVFLVVNVYGVFLYKQEG